MNETAYRKQFFNTNRKGYTPDDIDYLEVKSIKQIIKDPNFSDSRMNTPEDKLVDRKHDVLIIKQMTHFKDGKSFDETIFLKDFKRPVYTTKKGKRKHTQKKSREWLKNVIVDYCTDSDMGKIVRRRLGGRPYRSKRDLRGSLFVYGIEVSSEVLFKQYHMERNRGLDKNVSSLEIMFYDVETQLVNNEQCIDIATTLCDWVYKDGQFLKDGTLYATAHITERYHRTMDKDMKVIEQKVLKLLKKNLDKKPGWFDLDKLRIDVSVHRNEGDAVEELFKKVEKQRPDVVTAWNLWFDVGCSVRAIEDYPIRSDGSRRTIHDVFSDSSLPKPYQEAFFKEGPAFRITQAGKKITVLHYKRIHQMLTATGWQFVDQMSAMYYIAEGSKARTTGYSLESFADEYIDMTKFKPVDTEGRVGMEEHDYLRENFKIEYLGYNTVDNVLIYGVEKESEAVSKTLPLLLGESTWMSNGVGTEKTMNNFHFHYLDDKKVLGTKRIREAFSKEVPRIYKYGRKHWTVTISQYLAESIVLPLFSDLNLPSNMKPDVQDSDIVSAYPSVTEAIGVSEETVQAEVIEIEGFDQLEYTDMCKGQVLGRSNAGRFCRLIFDAPSPLEVLNMVAVNRGEEALYDIPEREEDFEMFGEEIPFG